MTDIDDLLDNFSTISSKVKEDLMMVIKGIYKHGDTMWHVIPLELTSLTPTTFHILNITGDEGIKMTYRSMELRKLMTDFRKVDCKSLLSTYPLLKNFVEALKEKVKVDCENCQHAILDWMSSDGSHCIKRNTFLRCSGEEDNYSVFENGKWVSCEDCLVFKEKERK